MVSGSHPRDVKNPRSHSSGRGFVVAAHGDRADVRFCMTRQFGRKTHFSNTTPTPSERRVREMAVDLDGFSPRERITQYPYDEWLCGRVLGLELGTDFWATPKSLTNSILSYARRNDIAAVAVPVRDRATPGKPFRFVEVWGDPERTWDEGPPADVRDQMLAAGIALRG